MMRSFALSGLLLVLLGMAAALPLRAQSTTAATSDGPFFHDAARAYLDDNVRLALRTIDEGLRVDPGNARLRALRKIIQQQQSNAQGGSSQQRASQPNASQSQQEGGEQRQRETSPQREAADQQGQNGQSSENRTSGESSPDDVQNERLSAGSQEARDESELSPAQAARILRALESQEKQLLRQVQQRKPLMRNIEKEW